MNLGITRSYVPYVGPADVAVAGTISTDGKLGGIHQGNVVYTSVMASRASMRRP